MANEGNGGVGGQYSPRIEPTNGNAGMVKITFGGDLQIPQQKVFAYIKRQKDYYKWVNWTQPVLTADSDTSGIVTSASGVWTAGFSDAYKALDGTATDRTSWFPNSVTAWWKIKLPYKIKITSLFHTNRNSGDGSQGNITGRYYADTAMTIPIGNAFTLPKLLDTITLTPAEPIVTDTIYFNKTGGSTFSGIGELVITAMKAELSTESDYDFWEY